MESVKEYIRNYERGFCLYSDYKGYMTDRDKKPISATNFKKCMIELGAKVKKMGSSPYVYFLDNIPHTDVWDDVIRSYVYKFDV